MMKVFLITVLVFCALKSNAQYGLDTMVVGAKPTWQYIATSKGSGDWFIYTETLRKEDDGGIKVWLKMERNEINIKGKVYKNVIQKQRVKLFCADRTYEVLSSIVSNSQGKIIWTYENEYKSYDVVPESSMDIIATKVCAIYN